MRHIGVVNKSKRISNQDIQDIAEACSKQLQLHAAPVWSRNPWPVIFYSDDKIPFDADLIAIFDNADVAGALGYHSETPNGKAYGRVFIEPILRAKGTVLSGSLSVSVTLSHEILEQFVDPDVNLWAESGNGTLYAIEVCDPVEAEFYNIKIKNRNISVSNFVGPEWFDKENPPGTKFDYLGSIKKPFTMSRGGYVIMRDRNGREHEIFAAQYPDWKKPGKKHGAARTQRRAWPLIKGLKPKKT